METHPVRIDAHQHFWQFDTAKYSWINDEMSAIKCDFLPADLEPLLAKHQMNGCIVVQIEQNLKVNDTLLAFAEKHDFIKGVVGWVDLQAADIEQQLNNLSIHKKLKGFRHVLQNEPNRAYMLGKEFMYGISLLKQFNFTYDILIHPNQLIYIESFISAFPDQPFVLNHLGKPNIGQKEIKDWAKQLIAIAKHKNMFCKLSGLITEADWHNWQQEDIEPYLDVAFNAFGAERLMFGSDWPVCNLAGGYDKVVEVIENYTSKLSAAEQARVWGLNAAEFYGI